MTNSYRALVGYVLFAVFFVAVQAGSPASLWEGTINVPGNPIEFSVDLDSTSAGVWVGEINIPAQGMANFQLTSIEVGSSISFAIPGVRGNPVFRGTLTEGGAVLIGKLSQGSAEMPFRLERKDHAQQRKGSSATASAFPETNPENVGIPARALELLAGHAQTLVDNEEIVGGELIVIKNRQNVFRRAFGWKDRETEQPLAVDSIYCVRSMTKPLVGTAIQMLIDEDRLRLDTPVYEILPFFAGPNTNDITVRHLLTHTGGFPFTTIGKPLSDYADLAEVAAEAAASGVGFEPGTRFEYSDAGSDTLGAIVARITGAPVEQFIQERILDPLQLQDTIMLLGKDDNVLARIPSAYSGGTGAWSKHWEPSDSPIFPLFLTSQSLYSTTTDYARFLTLWMDGGRIGDRRLLSAEAVERALSPGHRIENYPKSFDGLDVYYGQQWMVYAKPNDAGSLQPVLFGHDGSDGTHAWVWPELDLMVLFFTQSRGTLAGLRMGDVVQKLLVEQSLDDPSLVVRLPGTEELKQVAGLYWDETNRAAYYVVSPRGNRLTVERPGRMYEVFKAGEKPGRYVHTGNPRAWMEFVRSEDGTGTGRCSPSVGQKGGKIKV